MYVLGCTKVDSPVPLFNRDDQHRLSVSAVESVVDSSHLECNVWLRRGCVGCLNVCRFAVFGDGCNVVVPWDRNLCKDDKQT